MKKIGILTLPLTSRNYGGILQAYALSSYIKKRGFYVEVLDRRFNRSFKTRLIQSINSLFSKDYVSTHNGYYRHVDQFVEKYISRSRTFYNKSDLDRYIHDFDVLITGSDQVWRPLYSKSILPELFLDFTKKPEQKKLSYAASFGTDTWENPELNVIVSKYLSDFDGISVREDSGIDICRDVLGIESAEHHIDPTLLLEPYEYSKLFQKETNNHYQDTASALVTYVLDRSDKKRIFIESVGKFFGNKICPIGVKEKISRENYHQFVGKQCDSVEQWLSGIANSDFVVTDSFHGVVFSILFEKNFIAIGNKERGLGRFNSLLKLFGLEKRLVALEDAVDIEEIVKNPINYYEVRRILEFERAKSMGYFDNFFKSY